MHARSTLCVFLAGGRLPAESAAAKVAAHESERSLRRVAEVRQINDNLRPLTTASRALRHCYENVYQDCDTEPPPRDGAPRRAWWCLASGYQVKNNTPASRTSASTATRMAHVGQPSTANGGRRDVVIAASFHTLRSAPRCRMEQADSEAEPA
jgi:hypothetical protein